MSLGPKTAEYLLLIVVRVGIEPTPLPFTRTTYVGTPTVYSHEWQPSSLPLMSCFALTIQPPDYSVQVDYSSTNITDSVLGAGVEPARHLSAKGF